MDIKDIITGKEFKESSSIDSLDKLDIYLTGIMVGSTSDYLLGRMLDVFGYDGAKEWYFSKSLALGNKRPYDYCKQDKSTEIENELVRMEHGIIS